MIIGILLSYILSISCLISDLCSNTISTKDSTIMSMVIIAPIVAPVIGALLLKYLTWRAGFFVLAGIGTIGVGIAFLMEETTTHRYTGSIFQAHGRLFAVLKNRNFSIMLALFSPVSMFIMSFLAASSFIYINDFGLSEQQYSYFLAFNAIFALVGSLGMHLVSLNSGSLIWMLGCIQLTIGLFGTVLCNETSTINFFKGSGGISYC